MSHKMFNHSRGGYKANIKQPPRRGQPPKRGQKCRSQSVLSLEVSLYRELEKTLHMNQSHAECHQLVILSSIPILCNSPPSPLSLSLPDQLSGGGDLNGVVIIEEEGAWLARARREVESQAKKMLMQGLELMVSSPHPQVSPQTTPTSHTSGHTHKSHLKPHPLITNTTPTSHTSGHAHESHLKPHPLVFTQRMFLYYGGTCMYVF